MKCLILYLYIHMLVRQTCCDITKICGSGFGGLLGIALAINQKGQDDCRRVLQDLSGLFNTSSLNVFSWYR